MEDLMVELYYDIFLSTPSARRATLRGVRSPGKSVISIHALREEGDSSAVLTWLVMSYFYPRPPRGGRRKKEVTALDIIVFLSTPSARRAT